MLGAEGGEEEERVGEVLEGEDAEEEAVLLLLLLLFLLMPFLRSCWRRQCKEWREERRERKKG